MCFPVLSIGIFTIQNCNIYSSSTLLSKVWKCQCTLLNSLSCWQLHKSIEIINWSIENCHSISVCSICWGLNNLIDDAIACVSCDVPLCKGVESFKLNVVSCMNGIAGSGWTSWEIDVISVNSWSMFTCVCASWNRTYGLLKGL